MKLQKDKGYETYREKDLTGLKWYKCGDCDKEGIHGANKFCPDCGVFIEWVKEREAEEVIGDLICAASCMAKNSVAELRAELLNLLKK